MAFLVRPVFKVVSGLYCLFLHDCQRYMYEMLGIADSSLSAIAKAGAGQKHSINHLNPNILYMMLAVRIFFFYVLIFMLIQICLIGKMHIISKIPKGAKLKKSI
jgi:hypothetical protein